MAYCQAGLQPSKGRVKDENGDKIYQSAVLSNYTPVTLKVCADTALADGIRLDDKIRARIEWSDMKMLRAILVFLDTQGWRLSSSDLEDDGDMDEIREAIEYITSHFREPFEAKGVDLPNIQDEIEEIVLYARKYLSLGSEGYQRVWYKLHTSPDASKWCNVLKVCELVFSLPFSNAHVEKLFSTLKIIKTDRRTTLYSTTLSDLLEIQVEGPLASFCADQAVSLWWKDCKTTRRVNQQPRKMYSNMQRETGQSSSSLDTDTSEGHNSITLDDWDQWFDLESTPESEAEPDSDDHSITKITTIIIMHACLCV